MDLKEIGVCVLYFSTNHCCHFKSRNTSNIKKPYYKFMAHFPKFLIILFWNCDCPHTFQDHPSFISLERPGLDELVSRMRGGGSVMVFAVIQGENHKHLDGNLGRDQRDTPADVSQKLLVLPRRSLSRVVPRFLKQAAHPF